MADLAMGSSSMIDNSASVSNDSIEKLRQHQNTQHKKRWRMVRKGATKEEANLACPPVTGVPRRKSNKELHSYQRKEGESPEDTARRLARNAKKAATARARYGKRTGNGEKPVTLVHYRRSSAGCLRKRADLVSGILGKYISDAADLCLWKGDPDLSFYMGWVSGDDTENVLERETTFVREIAAMVPILDDSNEWVNVLTAPFSDPTQLVRHIQEATSRNKVVVLRDYVRPMAQGEITVDFLQDEYNIGPFVEVEEHDSVKKQLDRTNPTVATTVGKFIADIQDVSRSAMILDLPLPRDTVPSHFHNLDDGSQAMAHTKFVDTEEFTLPREQVTDRTWALLHHAGTLSRWHRDTIGKLTIIIVDRGCKLWIEQHPRKSLTRSEIDLWFEGSMEDNDEPSTSALSSLQESDAATIVILPGDIVVQPAAAVHSVYTPIPSLTKGSSFWLYDSMHITEVARRHDAHSGDFTTNVDHTSAHTYVAFIRMILNIKALKNRWFPRRAIAALCLMVLAPGDYALRYRLTSPFPQVFDDEQEEKRAQAQFQKWSAAQLKGTWAKKIPCYTNAQDTAMDICTHMSLARKNVKHTVTSLQQFLDIGPWDEPGNVISLAAVWDMADQ
ncbi:uncharacterized protein ARMOST_17384 [Armillaria ostoyae]|uniref:JmjC domain-containing protein n=1 Tax=Armillaria ostoyae TaxID=47428 RepID=A0A284RYU1_ARMOS|nr:uncharacterized protein ARMOST_17384 [Armillaria ostoyae]